MTIKAFLVDDCPTFSELLVPAVEGVADIVFIGKAETEGAAVEWLDRNQAEWQLVVVDLCLADGSGFGVLSALEERQNGAQVIVLTNHATPETRRRCLALGASAVFDKSSGLNEFIDYCESQYEVA